jgi:hypothetical protein
MALDNDDIKQLIAILQRGLVEDQENSTDDTTKFDKQSFSKPKSKKRTKETDAKNLFEKMSEFKMHKDDIEIDKKLSKHPPTQRSRNFSAVDVKCRVCGREEKMNPILVESRERYKCNKCARSSG